jgi:polyisoprenoid-binding protein YceI
VKPSGIVVTIVSTSGSGEPGTRRFGENRQRTALPSSRFPTGGERRTGTNFASAEPLRRFPQGPSPGKEASLQPHRLGILVLAVFGASTVGATAAPVVWTPDLVHSRAEFTVSHLVVSKVWGHIPIRAMTITTDPGSAIPTQLSAMLDVTHEDTDDRQRDADLRSPTYFDIARYPTMDFVSIKITKTDADDFQVIGDLTIKNVTKRVSFPVHIEGRVPDGTGTRVGYSAQLHIDRRDFNLVDNSLSSAGVLLVGYDVTIGLTAEATNATLSPNAVK